MNKPTQLNVIRTMSAILVLTCLSLRSLPARADDDFALIKTSIHIDMLRGSDYWPPKATKSQNASTWIPRIQFETRGKVPSGARCSIAFTRPDGSAWFEFPTTGETTDVPGITKFETPIAGELDAYKKKYTISVGVFGFKIKLHDELAGKDEVLFAGKFKLTRVSRYQGTPDTKNDADYYVDHDWAMPIGYIWFKDAYERDAKMPPLMISTWFKGRADMDDIGGYLYYKGKLIGNTKSGGGSLDHNLLHTTSDTRPTDPRWELWDFNFGPVLKTVPEDASNPRLFALDKNPGDYEFKVLRKGQLCRDLKFTVGDDGKIVDNGIAAANKMGTNRIIVPMKIIGTLDGTWRQTGWKTEAFYGNPLNGFTAP